MLSLDKDQTDLKTAKGDHIVLVLSLLQHLPSRPWQLADSPLLLPM